MGQAADTEGGSPGGLPTQAGDSGGSFLDSASGPAGRASGASIASLGLGVFSSLTKGNAAKAGADFQAVRAERAAEFGKVQADLTDTTMREQLNTTLSNIDVIRAAARIDPTSPTTAAIEARQSMLSDRQRTAAVSSLRQQAADDEASAKYLRESGDFAVKMGYLDAGVKTAAALAKMG